MADENRLIKFYRKIINMLGLIVDDDGFIKVPTSNGKSRLLMHKGLPFVLPIHKHIGTLTETDENGNSKKVKVLFNPLAEDALSGTNPSLDRMKSIIDKRLNYGYIVAIQLILALAESKNLQKDADMELTAMIANLSFIKNKNITKVVDETSIKNFEKLSTEILNHTHTKGITHLYVKNGGSVNGTKYKRVGITYLRF